MARSSYEGTNEEVMAMRDAELAQAQTQTAETAAGQRIHDGLARMGKTLQAASDAVDAALEDKPLPVYRQTLATQQLTRQELEYHHSQLFLKLEHQTEKAIALEHENTNLRSSMDNDLLNWERLVSQQSSEMEKLRVRSAALEEENKILKIKKGPDDAVLIKLLRDDSDKKAGHIAKLMHQLEQLREVERIGRRDHVESRKAMEAVLERERESASVELCELKREVRRLRKLELELEARPPAAGGPRSAAAEEDLLRTLRLHYDMIQQCQAKNATLDQLVASLQQNFKIALERIAVQAELLSKKAEKRDVNNICDR